MPSFLVICGTVRKRRQPRRTIHSGNKYLIPEMIPNSVPFYFFCSVVYCTYHVLLSVNKTNFVEIFGISFISFCITVSSSCAYRNIRNHEVSVDDFDGQRECSIVDYGWQLR